MLIIIDLYSGEKFRFRNSYEMKEFIAMKWKSDPGRYIAQHEYSQNHLSPERMKQIRREQTLKNLLNER